MDINRSIKFPVKHFPLVTSVKGAVALVPDQLAHAGGVIFLVPIAEPLRRVARFRIVIPDNGFIVFRALIIARRERRGRSGENHHEYIANKNESSHGPAR